MNPDDLAQALHTEASTCAVIALPMALVSLSWLLAGRWEGAPGLAVAAALMWVANATWNEADRIRP